MYQSLVCSSSSCPWHLQAWGDDSSCYAGCRLSPATCQAAGRPGPRRPSGSHSDCSQGSPAIQAELEWGLGLGPIKFMPELERGNEAEGWWWPNGAGGEASLLQEPLQALILQTCRPACRWYDSGTTACQCMISEDRCQGLKGLSTCSNANRTKLGINSV